MAMLNKIWTKINQNQTNGNQPICPILSKNSCSSTLASGQCIDSSAELCSDSKRAKMNLMDSGILNIYTVTCPSFQMWSNEVKGGVKACMLDDGNFVIYNSNNEVIWSTNTAGHPGATLKLEDFKIVIEHNGQVIYPEKAVTEISKFFKVLNYLLKI